MKPENQVAYLDLQNENTMLRGEIAKQVTEIKKLESALASTNPYLPFWVGEAPLKPGPRDSRYAIFNAHETWFIRDGEDREEVLGLCHQICAMLNRAWSMARGKE